MFFVPIKSKNRAWEVTMAGNGMDVPSVGFVLLAVGLARVATSTVSIDVILRVLAFKMPGIGLHTAQGRVRLQYIVEWSTVCRCSCNIVSIFPRTWAQGGRWVGPTKQEEQDKVWNLVSVVFHSKWKAVLLEHLHHERKAQCDMTHFELKLGDSSVLE